MSSKSKNKKKAVLSTRNRIKAGAAVAAGFLTGLLLSASVMAGTYDAGGIKVSIPDEYEKLLTVETGKNGALISVSETASIEAAEKLGTKDDGAGWLFSITEIDEDTMHALLCNDMSGCEIFAKDGKGEYYVYNHPTDVRFVREQYTDIEEDEEQWTVLNEWASGEVRGEILKDNEGLEAVSFGNTELDMCLARAAYQKDADCTVSCLDPAGPLSTADADVTASFEKLLAADIVEADAGELTAEETDGEYVVLNFEEEGIRFDFLGNNLVREMRTIDGEEEAAAYFRMRFADDTVSASSIMEEIYSTLKEAQ